MAKDAISLVRFEASDLHGISRSKMVPAHHFQVSDSQLWCNWEEIPFKQWLERAGSPALNQCCRREAFAFTSEELYLKK